MSLDKNLIKTLKERTSAGLLDCRRALQEAEGDLEKAIAILKAKGLALFEKRQNRVAGELRFFAYYDETQDRLGILGVLSETDFAPNNEAYKAFFNKMLQDLVQKGHSEVDESYDEGISLLGSQLTEKLSIHNYEYHEAPKEQTFVYYLHKGKMLALLTFEGVDTLASEAYDAYKRIAVHIIGNMPSYLTKDDIDAESLAKLKEELQQGIDTSKPEDIQKRMLEGQLDKKLKENALLSQAFAFDEKQTVQEHINQLNTQFGLNLRLLSFKIFGEE